MSEELNSLVKVFEEIEKIRRGCEAKLTHLAKNRKCLSCDLDFMPKRFEPCPECGSENTRMMKQRRRCLDCGHRWEPAGVGRCPWCGDAESVENPKDDGYIRNTILPRLLNEEKFYEGDLREVVEAHPAWRWAQNVKGAGLTTIGRLIGKTDIKRVKTCSEMWAHCGFGLNDDGTIQRKRAGHTLNYDAQLQSNCVILGESLLRQKDSYYNYYLSEKVRHAYLTPAHCHNRAFRHMIKLFLSHFWQTWREAEGLPAPPPYAFSILKHTGDHLISPLEMVKLESPIKPR